MRSRDRRPSEPLEPSGGFYARRFLHFRGAVIRGPSSGQSETLHAHIGLLPGPATNRHAMLDAMAQITSVDESQWAQWREVRLRALKEAPYAFGSTYEGWKDAPESRWRNRLGGDGLHLLASMNGTFCGMASGIEGDRKGTVELISMWVDPATRGLGIADALIDRIAQWAATRADELWLAVVPMNRRAIAVYRRHGFRPAEERGDPLPDGSGNEILMVKKLGSPAN